jgi:TPP-dependent 2-oxoacid decarboxylase
MSRLTRREFVRTTAAGLVGAEVVAADGPLGAQAPPAGRDGSITVGGYLATRLEQAGVRHYFVVPGDFNLVLLDQLLTNPRLKMIGCCNELNAGYAADGYARSNGVAALVVTYSVGGLSAANAVACAYAEDLPVLVIVGGINSDSGCRRTEARKRSF